MSLMSQHCYRVVSAINRGVFLTSIGYVIRYNCISPKNLKLIIVTLSGVILSKVVKFGLKKTNNDVARD